ncbi:MKI67 FHA domain-interacting nucleolar phosphoprotein [Magnaporthiopsis poae ATCC 64411]|uniref:MKI67 FHA domain-interacting nucleolar phosphoprotein n=1 Tax=Magnaporthiopsis poae (strain ATCC 64411 / 73-15) TaxID=644358 RepID=A0A0C4E7U3_MAGP6|nr:MKI67 FHA domain-interacting nucleolar phosphoprotein [Magnaporthiopsis poae ATCC 64411]
MAVEVSKKKGRALRAKPKAEEEVATKLKAVASPQPTKRKAAEDASPVASKKAKSTKAAPTEKKVKGKKEAASAVEEDAPSKPKTKKSPKKAQKEEEPVKEPAVDEEADEGDEEEERALAQTLGFSDDDGDDGQEESTFKQGGDVGVIPKVSNKTKKSIEASAGDGPRVIYIGHIPYGFFEHEIRQYLTQFGTVTNLRLSRNKKTGASKGYAFVEFADASTAAIVAKTMDAYLLFGRILKVKLVPKDSQHENLFKGANRRFKTVPWTKMAGRELEKPKGEATWEDKVNRESRRRSGRLEKLKATMGYEFEAPALKSASAAVADARKVPALEGKEESKAIEAPPAVEESPAAAEPEPETEAEKTNGVSAKKAKASAKGKKGVKGKKTKS